MTVKPASIATAIMICLAVVAAPRARPNPGQGADVPVFRLRIWGDISADFSLRVAAYFDLRSEVQRHLPALRVTDDQSEITAAVLALRRGIRSARANARQGDVFTPSISARFKQVLLELNASSWAAIADDNPGELSVRINDAYPSGRPLSTVPPSLLVLLPRLPDDIEYRFLGRHLILFDTRAGLVIDQIPYAVQCVDRDKKVKACRGE